MIKYVTPLILTWSLVNSVIQEFSKAYGGYPQWALNIGWAVAIGAVVLGFAVFARLKGQEGAEEENLQV
ncbi:Sodium:neurotransmitter symporter family protein [Candidatus Frackibacter sp. WG12]|nr:MAG: hypothetical protein AWU54_242 [Candidatus Frackibacter sp. T328-2]SDC66629.1 Sodium:neurotransmitter symporter family protein [Candidatus Frackibacter sp. WG11]SEM79842.1 Sodium:neurotransmitter symporter family protein [Candidatus Frackibacter sp. WG12]SFL90492.1 Sodium:neurotransmitter symporter family protein [Candidatus Frackibacter sp. WG13]